jgi:nucleoside-diphosphate-sugar epimerase
VTVPVSRRRRQPILLTGATGYVGGRLLRVLEERPGGTLIHDIVLYRMQVGPLGAIAHRILVARDLERIIHYRRDAVDRLLCGRHNRLAPVGSER